MVDMELLRTFLVIYRAGSLTEAAYHRSISQLPTFICAESLANRHVVEPFACSRASSSDHSCCTPSRGSEDAAPHMARMEAAAYDVLLRNATWHDPSPARRQLINFMSVPGTRNAGSVLLQPGATVMVDWIDPFGIYPIDWERRCTINDPWVWRMPGQT